MVWGFLKIIFKNYKNEKGEGCCSEMSANTSEFCGSFPQKAVSSELTSLSIFKRHFFVPTKEMLPVTNAKFCKEYEQQKTWLQGVSCT